MKENSIFHYPVKKVCSQSDIKQPTLEGNQNLCALPLNGDMTSKMHSTVKKVMSLFSRVSVTTVKWSSPLNVDMDGSLDQSTFSSPTFLANIEG